MQFFLFFALLFMFHDSYGSFSRANDIREKPLDGVFIEAVERYYLPGNNQIIFGMGYWPTNAYFNGFGLNISYQSQINHSWAWEVARGTYIITVDKSLTNQLAENFQVAPEEIERLSFAVSTQLVYYSAYGKFIFRDQFVRYFRMATSFGVGLVGSGEKSEFVPSLGAKMEVYGDAGFSWVLGVQNYVTFKNSLDNVISVEISTVYSF